MQQRYMIVNLRENSSNSIRTLLESIVCPKQPSEKVLAAKLQKSNYILPSNDP